MDAIAVEGLYKSFADASVLRGFNLQVASAQIYGLLGPNGTGKSTLLHLMMGFLRPDAGQISILGQKPQDAHAQVGYLPERLRYHVHCSGREYLRYMGQLGGARGASLNEQITRLLHLVGLEEAADRRMKTYSKGMLQRIGIAQALLSNPTLLLIDEPSSGLDPEAQLEMQELLRDLRDEGHTIFLCSHELSEIMNICDRVGILVRGQLVAEANPALLPGSEGTLITLAAAPPPDLDFGLRSINADLSRDDRFITLPQADPVLQEQVLRLLLDRQVHVQSIQPTIGTLRDLYVSVVRGNAPPAEALPATPRPLLDTLLAEEESA